VREVIRDQAILTLREEQKDTTLENSSRFTRHLDGVLTVKCILLVVMEGVLRLKSLKKRASRSTIKFRLFFAKETSVVSSPSTLMS